MSKSSSSTISDKTLTALGNLVKLLPTGTVFVFQFLSPVLTNKGQCNPFNKVLTSILLGLCGFSCLFSSFTDSYTGSDGIIHYGIVTLTGLWPSPNSGSVDLSSYKLRFADFVHAFFALIVFAVLCLFDTNTVHCFYPSFETSQKAWLLALPPFIGAISGTVFMAFPNSRHGIGYPSSDDTSNSKNTP